METIKWAVSRETAYMVDDYPYGSLKCKMFFWIETVKNKGDRYVTQSINPKNGRENAPKKSTYSAFMYLFVNEKGHVKPASFDFYHWEKGLANFNSLVKELGVDAFSEQQKENLKDNLVTHFVANSRYQALHYSEGDKRKEFVKWVAGCTKWIMESPFEFMANIDMESKPEPDLDENYKPVTKEAVA